MQLLWPDWAVCGGAFRGDARSVVAPPGGLLWRRRWTLDAPDAPPRRGWHCVRYRLQPPSPTHVSPPGVLLRTRKRTRTRTRTRVHANAHAPGCWIGCWMVRSSQHLRLYQDWDRLVTVRTYGDLIVLPSWETRLSAPWPFYIIATLIQPILALC